MIYVRAIGGRGGPAEATVRDMGGQTRVCSIRCLHRHNFDEFLMLDFASSNLTQLGYLLVHKILQIR